MEINANNISRVKLHIERLLQVINHYEYLTDSYIIEFFVKDHWNKLPLSWRRVLASLSPKNIAENLFSFEPTQGYNQVFPLSLLALKVASFHLPLKRHYTHTEDVSEFSNPSQSRLMKHIFRKHVNPKKQHEIRKLSELISSVALKSSSNAIVDIGAGQGYLSRLLSVGHHIKVTAIEAKQENVDRAMQYDQECFVNAKKEMLYGEEITLPNYAVRHIPPYVSTKEFKTMIAQEGNNEKENILLTGLHACGDLSSTMVNTFVKCDQVRSMVSVACCYMKLSEEAERYCFPCDEPRAGYPMSCFVAKLKNHKLSYKSREISCHANEKYVLRLKENKDDLKMHCYRAMLEVFIRRLRPDLVRPGVQTVKKAHLKAFHEYAQIAFAKLSMPCHDVPQRDNQEVAQMYSHWHNIVTYYVLCLMLAPLIETVILLDRAVYLYENGFESSISCIFDPSVSPRCFALTAMKD